ncbi:MAG: primosomal protein N' [Clostridiales bacterium]|nr:primosomal protein N' [Clostridiales bacterium]
MYEGLSGGSVARVRILELPFSADKTYDYLIPPEFADRIHIGSLAAVAFGASKRRTALVIGIADSSEYDRLKPILDVADERFSLDPELLGLCMFLRERTFCSTGEAVQTIIPGGALSSLYHAKRDPVERYYRLNVGADMPPRLGSAAKRAIEYIADDECSETELRENVQVSSSVLKNLVSKGILTMRQKELFRNPYAGRGRVTDNNILSAEQTEACNKLTELALSGEPKAALLYGVTGSGKTRVIKAVIDNVIASGRSVIVLVPEISLTGQTVELFCGYFGERVAVIHSSLSEGERLDAWKRIRAHEVDVVIGTRSAIFAPLDNLGMIVIDEEQEHTYKSDMNPKYHTRDIARYRAAKNNALMLLASATPSLESFHKAMTGAYSLVTLRERYGNAVLPDVIIADLRADTAKGKITPIGAVLQSEIEKNLASGEQTILFVSRRGYNNFVSCQMCGEVITCPHCSVSLTYHRHGDNDMLKCHYCGYTTSVPDLCPECSSPHLSRKGFGTQLVAGELAGLYPNARILRLDADATAGKFSHEAILTEFREHRADILIGTQMVTKGHNFPDVTLVGVINADSALYLDDFRATERTFALLTQVIGRAGRADKPGRAVLQTYSPDNDTIIFASGQDYDSFYKGAIKLRQQLVFPPFCDFVLLGISGEDEPDVLALTLELDKRLRELVAGDYSDLPMYIFGPLEAPVYKVNNSYRMRIILKCALNKRLRELITQLMCEFSKGSGKAAVSVDLNPSSI